MWRDLTNIFIDEIYSKPPKKNYETIKIIYNHIDEIWSIDPMDVSDYNISNHIGCRYIFIIIDNFSKYTRCTAQKNESAQKITDEVSDILTS